MAQGQLQKTTLQKWMNKDEVFQIEITFKLSKVCVLVRFQHRPRRCAYAASFLFNIYFVVQCQDV